MIGALVLASVLRIWQPDPVVVPVHAGMMTRETEVVCVAADVFLEKGEVAHISTGAQFVSEMRSITIGIGRYLIAIDPDGIETMLVHPHVGNHSGIMQHYLHCPMTGFYEAEQPGQHRIEYRAYIGTSNLKKDSAITSVYNEMSVWVHSPDQARGLEIGRI